MSVKPFSNHCDMALNLVDLDLYPIDDLAHKGAGFLTQCQHHMQTYGWCSFDRFIREDALEALAKESNALLPSADILTIKRNIYQGEVDKTAPAGDPKRVENIHKAVQLANDQIPVDTLLQQLYLSNHLTDFIRQVQQKPVLYRCADEFQALNVVALQPGNHHAWHYDTTECTITLLLQAAQSGGEFAFIPNSRTDDWEDHEAVKSVLSGDLSRTTMISRSPGTLTLFRGGYSLHGVTEVEGEIPRISAILTYDEQPERVISDDINIRIYGQRVEKILAQRKSA